MLGSRLLGALGMKMRLLLCLLLTVISAVSGALAQQRQERVALIIGNAGYPDATAPLSTTVRDVRALADELRRAEFSVDLKENLGKEEMKRAIDAFVGKIRNGTVALFYFSGYGIQVARQTYLIPVNAQVWTEAEVRRDGVSLDALLADIHAKGAKVKIVIVDGARRNPFERRFRSAPAGLAALDVPDGTLAMYSAALGKVINDGTGTNSVFASELLKELRESNKNAEEVFNRTRVGVSRATNGEQVPWVSSSLVDEFYFNTRSVVAAPAPPSPRPEPAPRPEPVPPTPSTPASSVGEVFRDCSDCVELVVVPAGSFEMGTSAEYENPVRKVTIAKPFAIGRYEITFDEWDKCVDEGGCKHRGDDRDWGRGKRPAINLSWLDAKEFTAWLSKKTEKVYRLPSEAEWEYAARAGTATPYWWGREVGKGQANCRECATGETAKTLPVGSFKANAFGLFDTAGNAAEWVEDCWNDNYRGAPANGTAWTSGQCRLRVLRGGAFDSQSKYLRSMARFRYDNDVRYVANGFRVVRELP
jgi:formylglycine-generating enzyme required for sulfatase activity